MHLCMSSGVACWATGHYGKPNSSLTYPWMPSLDSHQGYASEEHAQSAHVGHSPTAYNISPDKHRWDKTETGTQHGGLQHMPLWRAAGATEDSWDIGGRFAVIMPRECRNIPRWKSSRQQEFPSRPDVHACSLSCVPAGPCTDLWDGVGPVCKA